MFKSLLILGLDALPWSIVNPMIEAGHMPFLKSLRDGGASGILRSTTPHQTPAAWTTFMTGVQPGMHGIVNWERYDARTNSLALNNVERISERTIYRFFSDAGLRVGVVMQPLTYPPFAVNGFLLSGFDSPGIKDPFAYPRELEKEILELCPEHDENLGLDEGWNVEGHEDNDEAFAANIDLLCKRVRRVAKLAIDLHRRHPTDVLMVYFQDPDLILHRAWKWCENHHKDTKTQRTDENRRSAVFKFFKELDTACAELDAAYPREQRLTLALSDHGQRADALRVRMNTILIELGFLVPASGLSLLKDGMRRISSKFKNEERGGLGVPINWEKTRAFMPFQSCTGFIYVNLKGRQPFGSVEPQNFVRVRDEIVDALKRYREPFFDEIGVMDAASGWDPKLELPDIFVQPKPGIEFVRRAKLKQISFPTKRPYAGLHDPDGMYVLSGNGIARANDKHAHIVDLAPTLMAAMKLEVPTFMQGKVLTECFEQKPEVKTRNLEWNSTEAGSAYDVEQAAVVEKRLADLGYLD